MDPFPTAHKPGIVVLDLDFTVWPYWADCHLTPPFSANHSIVSRARDLLSANHSTVHRVQDAGGKEILLYPDITKILQFLEHHQVPVAVASKSPQATLYEGLLKLFGIYRYFVQIEVYRQSKSHHMKAISEGQGIAYHDMLFFDDCRTNIRTTGEMGVTAVHCPDQRAGLTWELFVGGLRIFDIEWNRRN